MYPPTLVNLNYLPTAVQQGELMMITTDYTIYHLPCGDLCASTCLDQAEDLPTYEVGSPAISVLRGSALCCGVLIAGTVAVVATCHRLASSLYVVLLDCWGRCPTKRWTLEKSRVPLIEEAVDLPGWSAFGIEFSLLEGDTVWF